MVVDSAALRAEVNAGQADISSISEAYLDNCVTVADLLLRQYAGENYLTDIPTTLAEKAWLAVAVEIFNQRRAPNGVLNQTFQTFEGTVASAVRIGADPLRPAYGLLSMWVAPLGFA